jgi:hypothetical protein
MLDWPVLSSYLLFLPRQNNHSLFQQVKSSESGIHFNNEIIENDSINPLDVTNIYNGGGVGIGILIMMACRIFISQAIGCKINYISMRVNSNSRM